FYIEYNMVLSATESEFMGREFGIYVVSDCSPVSLDQFKQAVYELFRTLDNFHSSSGIWGTHDSVEWESTLEQHRYVQGLECWSVLKPMYDYAEMGLYTDILYERYDGWPETFFEGLVKRMLSLDGLFEYEGQRDDSALTKVVIKYLARLRLDFWPRYEREIKAGKDTFDGFYRDMFGVTGSISFFMDVEEEDKFSVKELALLAGLKSPKPIRNAQYAPKEPLRYFKDKSGVFIERESALKYLQKARNYKRSTVDEYSPILGVI
ncbi:hypothetical protein, partial [Vibrio breoganii]